MGVFIGAGFWLLVGFIAYGLHQANALHHKAIIAVLLIFWAVGTSLIAYFYMKGDYLYHYGKVNQECGVIIYPTKPLSFKQQSKAITNRITIQSSTSDKKYHFRYIHDYYDNKLSFNGLKQGDKVCFDYVAVKGFTNGYPYWLKKIWVVSD